MLFLNLGNQNRKFVKLEGRKMHFNLFFLLLQDKIKKTNDKKETKTTILKRKFKDVLKSWLKEAQSLVMK